METGTFHYPFSIGNYSFYPYKLEFAGVTNLSVTFGDSSP